MAIFVFLNLPARGHINPTLPIVHELAARGHEVHYFTAEAYRGIVETAGAKFHLLPALQRVGNAGASSRKPPGDKELVFLPVLMAYQAPKVIPELVATIKGLMPDGLVYNTLGLWGRLIGQILNVPAIAFQPFHASRTRRRAAARFASLRLLLFAAAANRRLKRLAKVFGTTSRTVPALLSHTENLTLIFMPREFQMEGQLYDQRFLFVGPSFMEPPPEPWPFGTSENRGFVRVYISLGTLRNNDPPFYRKCFSAFDSSGWQVVMSVGDQIDLAALGPVPGNIVVERFVKQTGLLPSVDVFVTHGGLNSVMESLYFGVPVVVVPGIREQQLTARRVQELGLGVVVQPETLTAEALASATKTMALDPAVKTRVKEMQQLTRAAGGYIRAAEAIIERIKYCSHPVER
jgi:MGT family glycosyltransferase